MNDPPEPTRTGAAPPTPPQSRAARVRRGLRGARLDVTPLRSSREFRLLFIGSGVSFAGTMVTYVTVPYQAYALTRSSLVVGLLSLCEFVPILAISAVGGALADAVDRRLMVRITEVGMCLVTTAFLVNATLPHPQLWVLFVGVVVGAGIDSLQRPSLDALVPRVVPREQVAAAAALTSVRGNVGQLLGPALAGLLIAGIGLPLTFSVDVASFVVSLAALSMMRAVPPPPDATRLSLRSIGAGLRYAAGRRDLLGTYLVDMNAMFFGMPTALFPQIASGLGGPAVLGVLYASPAAGSFLAALSSGWSARVRHHGRAIAWAAAAWGVAITVFGFAGVLWFAVITLAAAGFADCVSGIFRQTMWNQTIPDAMRGRLAGIEMLSYTSGPSLGNLEAGVVGSLAGVRIAVVSGGLACIAGTAVIAAALPALRSYSAQRE